MFRKTCYTHKFWRNTVCRCVYKAFRETEIVGRWLYWRRSKSTAISVGLLQVRVVRRPPFATTSTPQQSQVIPTRMSSPLKFPSSDPATDQDMDGGNTTSESLPNAPPRQPLFFAGTPSAAGTPSRRRDVSAAPSSPSAMSGIMARRAVGMSTPRRKQPLFARE